MAIKVEYEDKRRSVRRLELRNQNALIWADKIETFEDPYFRIATPGSSFSKASCREAAEFFTKLADILDGRTKDHTNA